MEKLELYRKKLDRVDKEIIILLSKRFNICKKIAILKSENNIPMMQPERVKFVKESRRKTATELDVNATFIENLYGLIIAESCQLEDEIIDSLAKK